MSQKNTLKNMDNLSFEKELWKKNFQMIGGVDECGRGPLAGPVVSACVVMPSFYTIDELTDSKKIQSEKKRKKLSLEVYQHALAYGIGVATVEEIDEMNILEATILSMTRAVNLTNQMLQEKELPSIDYLLLDGIETLSLPIEQKSIVKGDLLSHSISCAAIIAKVYRDELMIELDKKHDGIYFWKDNKGYLTKQHQQAIDIYGIVPDHRQTWEPSLLAKKNLSAYSNPTNVERNQNKKDAE